MNIDFKDLLILIIAYFTTGVITSVIGLYLNYFAQLHLKKLQIRRMAKAAPEVEDNREK